MGPTNRHGFVTHVRCCGRQPARRTEARSRRTRGADDPHPTVTPPAGDAMHLPPAAPGRRSSCGHPRSSFLHRHPVVVPVEGRWFPPQYDRVGRHAAASPWMTGKPSIEWLQHVAQVCWLPCRRSLAPPAGAHSPMCKARPPPGSPQEAAGLRTWALARWAGREAWVPHRAGRARWRASRSAGRRRREAERREGRERQARPACQERRAHRVPLRRERRRR